MNNKSYELIKEYPNSPNLGYILKPKTRDGGKDNYYLNSSWIIPSYYPEYWKEIEESPNYDNVYFTVVGNPYKIISDGKPDEYRIYNPEEGFPWNGINIKRNFDNGNWKLCTEDDYNKFYKLGKYTPKQPLFTTTDGVDIYKGGRFIILDKHNEILTYNGEGFYADEGTPVPPKNGDLYFSTKEAAIKYKNSIPKKTYTIEEIEKVIKVDVGFEILWDKIFKSKFEELK